MLIPANQNLNVYRTGTFATIIKLFSSIEPLEKFPLFQYEASLVVEDILTLTVGNGLAITEENELNVVLTPAQTELATANSRYHYYIKLVKGSEVVFPMRGTLSFIEP